MDDLSNNSSISNPELSPPQFTPPDFIAITKLSQNLESLLFSLDLFADAHLLTAAGDELPVHRCILSARSPFFRDNFREIGTRLELKELANEYVISLEALEIVVAYLYTGKVRASPVGVCVCVEEECGHVACRPAVEFVAEVLYASFCFQISDLVSICQRHLLDVIDKVGADDVLVVLCVANICRDVCDALLRRCIAIVVNSDVDVVTLDKVLANEVIVKEIMDARVELGLIGPETMNYPDKHVKRIHKALDSDDVELVRMLLKEGNTTLDDACALHYAVAYCNAKTTTDLLDLAIADVNHTNSRGYTVLHVAAIRREPNIIVSLLTKGARPTDLTSDGRKALQISRRLTKAADYHKAPEKGRDTPKDRLCIEILEQAEYDPILGEASVTLAIAGDDLRTKLLYLENRVGLAKLLFPMEAKVAMDIARVEGTSEFPVAGMNFRVLADAQRTTMDLNDAPFKIKEEHLNRLRALSKTVELGKRFFPRCSRVLDKIMDTDDLSQLAFLGKENPDEGENNRQRYMEIQELLIEAFSEDKEESRWSNSLSSSSSSTNLGITRNGKHIL